MTAQSSSTSASRRPGKVSLALIESAELPRDHLARLPDFTREDRCRELPVLQRELGLSDSWWPAERSSETVCAGG